MFDMPDISCYYSCLICAFQNTWIERLRKRHIIVYTPFILGVSYAR